MMYFHLKTVYYFFFLKTTTIKSAQISWYQIIDVIIKICLDFTHVIIELKAYNELPICFNYLRILYMNVRSTI